VRLVVTVFASVVLIATDSVRFVGFNLLLAAAYFCSGTEIVDFLLEKGCDPSERDTRGYVSYLP
jgi:hypothetical protein